MREIIVSPTEDGKLDPEAKRALIIYELKRRDELPSSHLMAKACQLFPRLHSNTAIWVENQREKGRSDWPWFESAINFLDGYNQPGSNFERYREKLISKILVEIKRLEQVEAKIERAEKESSAQARALQVEAANNRKKLIGGLGGINSNYSSTSDYWNRVDAGHWREQQ